jgi:hypothetical protein
MLFRSLLLTPNLTTEDSAELEKRSAKASPSRGLMTPRKAGKSPLKRNLASDDDTIVPVLLRPILEELGSTTETAIDALRVTWKPLLTNQSTLQEALAGHAEVLAEVEAEELRTTRLEDDVGERMTESGNQN